MTIRAEVVNLPDLVYPAEAPSRPDSVAQHPERTACPPVADVNAHEGLYCDVVARLDRLEQKLTAAYRLVAASRELRDREAPVRPCDDRLSASRGDGDPSRASDGPNSATLV